jgi:hypothetical protein
VVASKILSFYKIDGKQNPSDVLTRYLPYAVFWPLVQPFLLWGGERVINLIRRSQRRMTLVRLSKEEGSKE